MLVCTYQHLGWILYEGSFDVDSSMAVTSTRMAAFSLTVLASIIAVILASANPGPLNPLFYPWICVPVICAGMPFRWPGRTGLSAALLVIYIFCPYSLSIGIFYIPGAVLTLLSAGL